MLGHRAHDEYTFHESPASILQEHMQSRSLSIKKLAELSGISRGLLEQILKGRSEITKKTAVKLGWAFRMPPHFWLKLQYDYTIIHWKNREEAPLNKYTTEAFAEEMTELFGEQGLANFDYFLRTELKIGKF